VVVGIVVVIGVVVVVTVVLVVGVVVVVDHVDVVVGVVLVVGAGGAETWGVGDEVAMLVPFLLLAVTATRMVNPTSPEPSKSVCAVAPLTGAHASPLFEQRSHWKLYVLVGPFQVPVFAVRVVPTSGWPLIDGRPPLTGALWPGLERDLSFPALALEVNTSSAKRTKALWRRCIPALSAVARRPLTRSGRLHSFFTMIPPNQGWGALQTGESGVSSGVEFAASGRESGRSGPPDM
jgi:hypothetical protein